jgi:hypothetical protein
MTKREALRQTEQEDRLLELGFTRSEAESLRRISMTLHRWFEKECGDGNGCIERDETTGRCYWFNANARYLDPHDPRSRWRIADRETGARKRLASIMQRVDSGLQAFVQTDPRGAALYILRPEDIPEGGEIDSYYNRGICVY